MDGKRREWRVLFKGSIDEFDNSMGLEYWRDKSTIEKFAETRSLIDQALLMQGKSYKDVSRFLRYTIAPRERHP